MFYIEATAIEATANLMLSDLPTAPEYRCAACARTVDSYVHGQDDTLQALKDFLEHTRYDHFAPADILEVQTKRWGRVLAEGEIVKVIGA